MSDEVVSDANVELNKKVEDALRAVQDAEGRLRKAETEKSRAVQNEAAMRQQRVAELAPEAKDETLRQLATEATMRNVILETARAHELDPEELAAGGDFQSPEEIRLRAQIMRQEKDIAQLKTQLGESRGVLEGVVQRAAAVGAVASAGTPRGGEVVPTEPSAEAAEFRPLDEEYVTIRKQGRTREARMRLLDTIHRDPRKLIPVKVKE